MSYRELILQKLCASYNEHERDIVSIRLSTVFKDLYNFKTMSSQKMEKLKDLNDTISKMVEDGEIEASFDSETGCYKTVSITKHNLRAVSGKFGVLKEDYIKSISNLVDTILLTASPSVQKFLLNEKTTHYKKLLSWFKYDSLTTSEELHKMEIFLHGCVMLENSKNEIFLRVASETMFKGMGSKVFESKYKTYVYQVLLPEEYNDYLLAKSGETGEKGNKNLVDIEKEMLGKLHILKAPDALLIKGFGTILFHDGTELALHSSSSEDFYSFGQHIVDSIFHIKCKKIITIENLTTFHECPYHEDAMMIYTGGFAGKIVVDALKKINVSSIYHSGDLDAYGFRIVKNLSEKTGFIVHPYHMNIDTYEKYKESAIPMTKDNAVLFSKMLEDDFYSEDDKSLFKTLLHDGKTLEQEALSA